MSAIEERIDAMSEAQLDALPQGIIRLDRRATVLYYNAAQFDLARREPATTIGFNFFRDVAPCTAVRDFEGRFNSFIEGDGTRIEPFDFIFRFPWGRRDVSITMIRRAVLKDEFYIVVTVIPTPS